MAALPRNSTLRTGAVEEMKGQPVIDERSLSRARARRTALIAGMVAIAIYLVAIGEVVLRR
ncbi:hypothetical protein [Dokdonella sp.]|uniref:hypothetical protein n=1 Tax=Dokdonella sp. TaxID=2291710 RepID=UPI003782F362